jgi:ABC-2 type transport system ATP-binding protein
LTSAIELHGVGKRYWRTDQDAMLLRSILPFARPKRSELWALRNLDFTVDAGETVGIAGRNGAGKTTLLRLLAGVTQPSEGRLRVVGRIAPLITLGLGFHGEMSGRENVYVNGALLGIPAASVRKRFDDIVEFAELADFIDSPVKFYSSGMFMRLAFGVLIHTDPEVLLVDEVLAVGDLAFQRKCFDRMRALRAEGTAIVMVSHSMYAIRQIAERVIVINKGGIDFDGEVEQAISHYYALASRSVDERDDAPVKVLETTLRGPAGESHHAAYDEQMELVVRLLFRERVVSPIVNFGLFTDSGLMIGLNTTSPRPWRTFDEGDETTIKIEFRARLGGGSYRLRIALREPTATEPAIATETSLFVSPRVGAAGMADVCTTIEIDGEDRTDRDAPLSAS